jgi:hypothetical protein
MTAGAFEVLAPPARAAARARYVACLRARNGVPGWSTRTLPGREPRFRELLASRPQGPGVRVDQREFDRLFADRAASRAAGAGAALQWCLALARIHAAEQFGASEGMGGAPELCGEDSPLTHIELEEGYHTRAVQEILGTLGLRFTAPLPDLSTRLMVRSMSALPARPAEVVVFVGELVGTVLFELLRGRTAELFEGAQLTHVERLLDDVIADERGHVAYARATLSQWQMTLTKAIYPAVMKMVEHEIPEIPLLFGAAALRQALRRGKG